ncbi:MAG: YdjY domain-containing protein [Thermodesulfovibrionales bacterium]|nr:YdjY domain-containing protein [Thermodesulfovibrionales bacterium]
MKDTTMLLAHDLPTRQSPLIINKTTQSILIYTELNLKSAFKDNPHWGIVARNGKLQDKAILKAFVDAIDFHDALISIGAKAGNNLTEDKTGISVAGDILEISMFWQGGRHYPIKDVFQDSSGKGFEIRFGGNKESAMKEKTGCITCLESCWIAITSNARYPNISNLKRTLSPNSRFKGNDAILPKIDGHPVVVSYVLLRI